MDISKPALREFYKARRQQRRAVDHRRANFLLQRQLLAWLDQFRIFPDTHLLCSSIPLALYYGINGEPQFQTPDFLALVPGKYRPYLPVVAGSSMRFRRFRAGDALHMSRFGIPEPIGGEDLDPASAHILITPALSVDLHGIRLGYGGGYYDRWLAHAKAVQGHPSQIITVCAAFEDGLSETPLPRETHDQAVDWIITESRVVETRTSES